MNTSSTTEERLWASLSHLSSLAFGMGILLPIIGWSDQRRKSRYAAFQTLQALGYQSLGFTIWILFYLLIMVLAAIVLLATLPEDGTNGNPDLLSSPGMNVFYALAIGLFALYCLFPILAAAACALGRDYRYPVLGARLAHYLGYEPLQKADEQDWLNEDHEFRWVAAAGHFSVLILLWGMLAPLTTWTLYGKRSSFLKFQSIQTLVYQAVATILFFVGSFIAVSSLSVLPLIVDLNLSSDFRSPIALTGLVMVFIFTLFAMLIILIVPLFHILGQWAGYRVLKGEDYRYPEIGRLVEKWMTKTSGSS
ncbi:MAG: DUF4870 domain-containing protein [Anaerolineales bacterium]